MWRLRVVSPEYFSVMQIPVVSGRTFGPRDGDGEIGRPRVAVVSRSFADRFWPGEHAIGKHVGPRGVWRPVVGVVGDVRYSGLESDPTLDVYLPQALFPQAAITLMVRTGSDPLRAVPAVRAKVRDVDADAFVTDIRTMEQVVAASQAQRRATTLLVMAFGLLALVLAIAGVYSVVSEAVIQRRREMAIRAALGSEPWADRHAPDANGAASGACWYGARHSRSARGVAFAGVSAVWSRGDGHARLVSR